LYSLTNKLKGSSELFTNCGECGENEKIQMDVLPVRPDLEAKRGGKRENEP